MALAAVKKARPWYTLPLDPVERVLVLGQTRSGKTEWVKRHVLPHAKRLLLFDPCGDYEAHVKSTTLLELSEHPELVAADAVQLAVRSEARNNAELAEEVVCLVELARDVEDFTLVWEEVGDYSNLWTEPDSNGTKTSTDFELSKLARSGRKQGLACVFVSQRATEIPVRVRAQASRIVSFVQSLPEDLRALEERCGEEFSKHVAEWRRGQPPAIWSLPSMES